MQYFKNESEISKEEAYKYIRETAKYLYNADYSDDNIDEMFSNPQYNSFTCIDISIGEKIMIWSKHEDYIITLPSENKQLSLF